MAVSMARRRVDMVTLNHTDQCSYTDIFIKTPGNLLKVSSNPEQQVWCGRKASHPLQHHRHQSGQAMTVQSACGRANVANDRTWRQLHHAVHARKSVCQCAQDLILTQYASFGGGTLGPCWVGHPFHAVAESYLKRVWRCAK